MGDELRGKIALVTGGTGDLGSAAAALLAEHGAAVALADLRAPSEAQQHRFAARPGGAPAYYAVDVRERASVAQMFSRLVESQGIPQIVVCNAGTVHNAHFLDVTVEQWEQTLA